MMPYIQVRLEPALAPWCEILSRLGTARQQKAGLNLVYEKDRAGEVSDITLLDSRAKEGRSIIDAPKRLEAQLAVSLVRYSHGNASCHAMLSDYMAEVQVSHIILLPDAAIVYTTFLEQLEEVMDLQDEAWSDSLPAPWDTLPEYKAHFGTIIFAEGATSAHEQLQRKKRTDELEALLRQRLSYLAGEKFTVPLKRQ